MLVINYTPGRLPSSSGSTITKPYPKTNTSCHYYERRRSSSTFPIAVIAVTQSSDQGPMTEQGIGTDGCAEVPEPLPI